MEIYRPIDRVVLFKRVFASKDGLILGRYLPRLENDLGGYPFATHVAIRARMAGTL